MTTSQRTVYLLGYGGLIPFVIPAILILANSPHAALLTTITSAYAFGIICFLCGSWWGLALKSKREYSLWLSNACFLLAFFVFSFAEQWWALAAAILLIILLITAHGAGLLSGLHEQYGKLRTQLTIIASASMLTVQLAGQ